MKSILLQVDADRGLEPRLAAALDLARAVAGRLICINVIPIVPVAPVDPSGTAMLQAVTELEQAAREYRVQMEDRLAATGVPFEWRSFQADPVSTVISQSRLVDVVVLSPSAQLASPFDPLPSVSDIVLHARAPVLAVPPDGKRFDPQAPALVAWDGSYEAATALRASVALLKIAPAVHIVTVGDEPAEYPASAAGNYLVDHDIASTAHHRPKGEKPIAETLVMAAEEFDAGYIIAGAYGHSRIRELFLGGVTRWMLRQSPVPLVLEH